MNKRIMLLVVALFCLLPFGAYAQDAAPMKLVKTMTMPSYMQTKMDHLAVDVKTHRVMEAVEGNGVVPVFNYQTGKLVHVIKGLKRPHAFLIRDDINRLFVDDDVLGGVQIYNLTTYQPLKFIQLLNGTDSMYYDPSTKDLYVVNGGKHIHQPYSFVSVINTDTEQKIADIRIEGETLEALRFEPGNPTMYVNDPAKNTVVIVNRDTRKVETSWPLTLGQNPAPMSLDSAHHRLFVGCRSRVIVVFDTQTGKELQALPIGGIVDDMAFDPGSQRIYAFCGGGEGEVDVYKETDPDHYQLLGKVPTRYYAKTGVLAPSINRVFVGCPNIPDHHTGNAVILEYRVE